MLSLMLSLVPLVNGVYFSVKPNQQRCFIESIPRDSVLKISYLSISENSSIPPKTSCPISAKGPKGIIAMPMTPLVFSEEERTLVLRSTKQGKYEICIACPKNIPEAACRWQLRFDHVGDLAMVDFNQDSATKTQVMTFESRLNTLLGRATDLLAEMEQEKVDDDDLRKKADDTEFSVLTASILQLILILSMNHLSAWSIGKFIKKAQIF
jgi:hypothetical protein